MFKGGLFAATFFKMETNVYKSMGLGLLKRHAIKDAEICEKKVKSEVQRCKVLESGRKTPLKGES